jgi:uncharacterized protein
MVDPSPAMRVNGARRVARLSIKVVPKASGDAIGGFLEELLKVRVTAPPERGKANAAVEALIAETLGVPRGHVRVVAGHGSARKTVEITGLSEQDLRMRLARAHEEET